MGSRNESADCTTKCDENHDPFLFVSSGRRLNFGFLIISELERMIFLYRQIREALDIPRTFSSAAPRRMYSEYPCLSSLSVKEYNMLFLAASMRLIQACVCLSLHKCQGQTHKLNEIKIYDYLFFHLSVD